MRLPAGLDLPPLGFAGPAMDPTDFLADLQIGRHIHGLKHFLRSPSLNHASAAIAVPGL